MQQCDLMSQLVRQPQVVAVEKGDEFATAGGYAVIARGGLALVALVQITYRRRVAGDHGSGVIGRAVVDDYDIQRAIGLCQNTVQGCSNPATGIPGRNHHGHSSGSRAHALLSGPDSSSSARYRRAYSAATRSMA